MSKPKLELRNTTAHYRAGNASWAAGISIFITAILVSYAYTKGYITFNTQNSLPDIIILLMVLFVITTLTGLILFKAFQFIGSRSGKGKDSFSETLIIDQPVLQKPVVRGLEVLISMTVWAFFLYLFQSLFTAVFWIFGGRLIFSHVFSPEAIEGTKMMLVFSLLLAAIMFLVMVSWASWNYWRYGRLERRKQRPPVADEIVAGFYGVPINLVQTARGAKVATVSPLEVGMVFTVETEVAQR